MILSLTGDYLIASSTLSAPGTKLCILSLNLQALLSVLGLAGQELLGAGADPIRASLREKEVLGGSPRVFWGNLVSQRIAVRQ